MYYFIFKSLSVVASISLYESLRVCLGVNLHHFTSSVSLSILFVILSLNILSFSLLFKLLPSIPGSSIGSRIRTHNFQNEKHICQPLGNLVSKSLTYKSISDVSTVGNPLLLFNLLVWLLCSYRSNHSFSPPMFESSHQQLLQEHYFADKCIEETRLCINLLTIRILTTNSWWETYLCLIRFCAIFTIAVTYLLFFKTNNINDVLIKRCL